VHELKFNRKRWGKEKESDGIAGFYDEMVVFFVVVISLFIFFHSAIRVYENYGNQKDDIGDYGNSERIIKNIRNSPILTYNGRNGMFHYQKILTLNHENFTGYLNTAPFKHYNIELKDLSNSIEYYNLSITNAADQKDMNVLEHRYVLTSPVNIWVDEEHIRPGQLKVEVWS